MAFAKWDSVQRDDLNACLIQLCAGGWCINSSRDEKSPLQFSGNKPGGPGRLKIVTSGNGVDIEHFSGKVEVGDLLALHGSNIHV